MKVWIGKNYFKATVALLLVCGSLFLTAGVLAYGTESPATFFGLIPASEKVLQPLSSFLGVKTAEMTEATVTTDKQDYRPGEIVQITGAGFGAGESVRLQVVHIDPIEAAVTPHAGHDPWDVMADSSGGFTAEWLVQEDSLNQTLLLTADGASSGLHAEHTFTDSSVQTYNQCSNDDGDGYATGDTGCRWTNGNLQRNNSTYSEGEATVQRLWMNGVAANSVHTLTLKYGTTKGGKHAYDYLTTYNLSETWVTEADRCQDFDSNANGAGGGCELWGADTTFPIPVDPNPEFTTGVKPPLLVVPQPAGRVFTMRNATITGVTTPTVVSGTYAGDSETIMTITFTVGSDADACPTTDNCSMALWFGAHIAQTSEWLSGGATTVSGSPYHVALDAVDGTAIGQRDNQMQAGAIISLGALTIRKQTIGGVGGPFNFTESFTAAPSPASTPNPVPASFNLTTTAPTNPASISWPVVPTGVHRITESSLPAGWDFTSLSCTGDGDSGNVINIPGRYVDIDLDNGESQVCTFTNTLQVGNIIIVKDAVPNHEQDFCFNNNFGNSNPPSFCLDDDANGTLPSSRNFEVLAGTYAVSEDAVAGWDLTNTSCSDGSPVGAIVVGPGETVTCTFVNTKRGKITIIKDAVPNDEQDFGFTSTTNQTTTIPPFSLDDDADPTLPNMRMFPDLKPGSYSVTETPVSGWDLTGLVCSTGGTGNPATATASILLPADGDITCTFTNTKRGKIIVIKDAIPSPDPQDFNFKHNFGNGNASPFLLDDDNDPTLPDRREFVVIPGAGYMVDEIPVPAGWTLTGSSCDDLSPVNDITVSPGEIVTCTFVNTKKGRIEIEKQTLPNGSSESFSFTGDVSGNLSDGQDAGVEVMPGNYMSTEGTETGWDLTSIVCNDNNSTGDTATRTANFIVEPGETVRCVFTNTQRANITIIKEVGPAPTYPDDFTFTNDFGLTNPASFDLDDDGNNANTLSDRRISEVLPGSYTVSETLTGYPWALSNLTCTPGGTPNVLTGTASIVVGPGGSVTCTFKNILIPETRGRIIVVKQTIPDDATLFTFNPSNFPAPNPPDPGSTFTAPFQLSDTQSKDSCVAENCLPVSAGFPSDPRYIVTETAVPGYVTTANCVSNIPGRLDSDPTLGIPLEELETVTCTFTNRKPSARISVSPLTATNEVNDPHTIEAFVEQDDTLPAGAPGDDANGFGPAPAGTLVTFSLLNNVAGATFVGGNTCLTIGTTGKCTVTINTTTAGGVDIRATSTFDVLGVSQTVTTGSGGQNSADAHKTYVDAQIDITPLDDTNRVGDNHTFTATVQQDDGIAAPGGDNVDGFGPAPNGTVVTFSFVQNTIGASFVGSDSCTVTNGLGTCEVTIISNSAGVLIVQATTTFTVGGLSITRTTGTGGNNSGNARKVYVDAQIDITPLEDTNRVGEDHTFTVTVQQDDGLPAGAPGDAVTGFGPAPNGTIATFSFIANNAGATFNGNVNTCTITNGLGTCTVTINAPNAGLVIVQATTTFTVGGLSITRTTGTGGFNSDNARKVYVDAQIDIDPLIDTNPVNQAHTFTATVQQDDGLPAGAPGDNANGFGAAPNGTVVTFSFVQNTIGAVFVGPNFCTITNSLGTCTVQINSSAPGVLIVQATTTFSVGGLSLTRTTGTGGNNSANAQKTYVSGNIIIVKQTLPDGDPQIFDFDTSYGSGDCDLSDGQSCDSGPLAAGTYSASENTPAGWDLTSATCDDGSEVGAISLQANETVTCTFTNTKRGHIIVVKDARPDSAQDFTFTNNFGNGNPPTFDLDDDANATLSNMRDSETTPGIYSVSEGAVTGWALVSATCSDGSLVTAIDVSAGETVTCTFVNSMPDAQIDLTPLDATNEVGDPHTITATVQQDDALPAGPPGDPANGFGPAPDGTVVTFSLLNNVANAVFVGGNTCTITNGLGTCSVQIVTSTPGGVDINATTTFNVLGVSLTRTTGTGGLNSGNAHKTYVDAQIDITPLDDTNRVGDNHTFTATVQQDDGIAAPGGDNVDGFGPAPNGTVVTFSFIQNTIGASFVGSDSCTITNGLGTCDVTITSSSAGVLIVQATTTFNVGGLPLTRTTGTGGLNSGNARKVYVDAQIDIDPLSDTNRVGEDHTFTATVQQDDGLPAGAPGDNANGFGPAPNGTTVTFSFIANNAGATFNGGVSTCMTAGGTGTCSVTINAPNAGLVIVQATTTFTVGGLSITRTTGTGGFNSTNAQKVYVDAGIGITPLIDTNPVNEAHTFTATVVQDDGLPAGAPGDNANGFGPAPNGTVVTFSFVQNTIGAVFVANVDTCTITNGLGTCTVQINSASPGVLIVQATTTFSVGGLSLTRTTGTGGNNSANAQKTYVAGKIIVVKQTLPDGSAQSFEFDPSYAANFFLTDGQSNDSGFLAPSTYSVAEVNVPADWDLTSATCDDNSPIGAIDLAANEIVTCTFTNTQRGRIIVDKITTPAGDPQSFAFTTTGAGYSGFSLTDAAAPNDQVVVPGAYSVAETVPAGWDLDSATCDQGETPASLDVEPGETVRCTFRNIKRGRIIVDKVTIPTGDPQSFDFSTTGAGYVGFSLTDAALPNNQEVVPGAYSVAETVPTGWDLTNAVCDMGETPASLDVGPGETVSCTFTNTKRAKLTIMKRIVNDNGGTAEVGAFGITTNAGALVFGSGSPDGANTLKYTSNTLMNLVPGTKSLQELNVAGYAEGTWSCNGTGSVNTTFNSGSVVLNPGEDVTCTITNNDDPGTIKIIKQTMPDGDPTVFNFDAAGDGTGVLPPYADFMLSDGQMNTQVLDAGNDYTVTETVPVGWILTGVGSCTVTGTGPGTSTATPNQMTGTIAFNLKNGDIITCTYENSKVGQVTRTQGFWGTHSPLANIAWFGGTAFGHTFPGVAGVPAIGDRSLCGRVIGPADLTGLGKLMGGFHSNIAKKTNGAKRTSLDQARMKLLQQLLAAELNASAFGSVPIGGSGQFNAWEAAFCGTNVTAVNTAQQQAAAFNENGDNGTFTPGVNADPQYAKSIANKPFWDLPSGARGIFTSTPTTIGDEGSIVNPAPTTTGDGE